jgi:hypothetical protein
LVFRVVLLNCFVGETTSDAAVTSHVTCRPSFFRLVRLLLRARRASRRERCELSLGQVSRCLRNRARRSTVLRPPAGMPSQTENQLTSVLQCIQPPALN